jgi:hypothetical protein
MAFTAQMSNFVGELMSAGDEILELRDTCQRLRERYSTNNFNSGIVETEMQAVAAYAHLNDNEIKRALGVLDALVLLIDSNIVVGGNTDLARNHLIRLKG